MTPQMNEPNESLNRLLLWVTIEASELIQFKAENKEARYETISNVWALIQKLVGPEQVRSLALSSPDGKTAFRNAAHWMGVLWATIKQEELDEGSEPTPTPEVSETVTGFIDWLVWLDQEEGELDRRIVTLQDIINKAKEVRKELT